MVRIAASYLDQAKYVVYTNPDGEKNTKIGNSYGGVADGCLDARLELTVQAAAEAEVR